MRRKRPSLGSTQNEVTKIARSVRTLIKWIAWLLVALFGYLQLKDIKIEGIVDNLNPDVLRRFTLFFYYSCWVAGSSFDTNMMEDVCYIDAGRARLPANAIILLVVFGAVTALMLWMAGNNQGFSLLLNIFFFINVLGIIYIQNFLSPVAKLSRAAYQQDENYIGLMKLELFLTYLSGSWQWYRFSIGGLILLLLNAVSFSVEFDRILTELIVNFVPILGAVAVFQLVPSLLLLIFVIVMEGWIWYKRLITTISFSVADRFGRSYVISPISSHSAR